MVSRSLQEAMHVGWTLYASLLAALDLANITESCLTTESVKVVANL